MGHLSCRDFKLHVTVCLYLFYWYFYIRELSFIVAWRGGVEGWSKNNYEGLVLADHKKRCIHQISEDAECSMTFDGMQGSGEGRNVCCRHVHRFCPPPGYHSEFTQQDGTKKRRAKGLCDKCDRAITCMFCCNLSVTLIFSGLLQKDLFKGRWSLEESFFKQNYCHACHTRFVVFFPLLSCYISSLGTESLLSKATNKLIFMQL